jgi:hypothetical protein
MGDQVRGLRAGLGPIRRPGPHMPGQFPDASCPAPRAAFGLRPVLGHDRRRRWLDVGHLMTALGGHRLTRQIPAAPVTRARRAPDRLVGIVGQLQRRRPGTGLLARRASAPLPQRPVGVPLPGRPLVPHRITRWRLPRIRGVLPGLAFEFLHPPRQRLLLPPDRPQLHRLRLDDLTQPGVGLPQPRIVLRHGRQPGGQLRPRQIRKLGRQRRLGHKPY